MRVVLTVFIILGITYEIFSQPLNGSYTIGGSNPDFATLQLAADALNARGVSGAVFFNIRPGTYSKNGGNNTVLLLDSTVAGLSETNKVTFQPDAASGGNVDNVILEMNITNPSTADKGLVLVSLDYITFRNITFQESDASQNYFNFLVQLKNSFSYNLILEGVVFSGCKFKGSAANITKKGIELGSNTKDITIRENSFFRLVFGVESDITNVAVTGSLIIEDNQFLEGFLYAGPSGSAIQVAGQNVTIRRNTVDFNGSFNGGYQGIVIGVLGGTENIRVEQNLIIGPVSKALQLQGSASIQADSILIVNNMVNTTAYQVWANEPAYGIYVYNTNNTSILFNTLVIHGGNFYALGVYSNNCKVFNNIIVAKPSYGFNAAYNQGNNPANLQSDYNSIYMQGGGVSWLVSRDAVAYYSLLEYQNATGLDTNSTSKDIEFVASDDLHLTDCQSQDPEIWGIPIQGITSDFDGEIRDAISPLMGADETGTRSNDMFGDPFIIPLPGTAFSIANGKFDNLLADGLAVPDYDNNRIRLFHYNGNRTYTPSGTLHTLWPPTETLFYDVDKDGYLDLIVGFYADRLQIFYGDGAGSFLRDSILLTKGHVKGMTVGIHNYGGNNIERVFLTTDDNNFVSKRSFMCYIDNNYAGQGRTVVVSLPKTDGSIYPDTIYSLMDDLAMANLDSNPDHEIVALTVGDFGAMYVFNDTTISGAHLSFGTHYRYGGFNTASYTPSSISIADFDSDGDNDILTTGYDWDELILIKNQGSLVFSDEVIVARQTRGFVVMDYENDGDLDIVTINERLEEFGISVYLNDGLGNFIVRENCYYPYADGRPWSVVASDFDMDGRTDIAITSSSDSLYVLYNLGGGTVGIHNEENEYVPTTFSLSQNFPNLFNPTTTIQYSLPQAGIVNLKVYNLLGEEVKTLVDDYQQAGKHSVQFNSNNLASGIYFYRLQAGSFVETKKMVLVK